MRFRLRLGESWIETWELNFRWRNLITLWSRLDFANKVPPMKFWWLESIDQFLLQLTSHQVRKEICHGEVTKIEGGESSFGTLCVAQSATREELQVYFAQLFKKSFFKLPLKMTHTWIKASLKWDFFKHYEIVFAVAPVLMLTLNFF